MSPEDSFTDARDLCNSTSEYQDLDEKSQGFSNRNEFLAETPADKGSPDFPTQTQNTSNFGLLNMGKVNRKEADFQDEFLAKYDEFSESWRAAVKKMQRF